MPNNEDSTRNSAPDLKILGDQVTFQPSGVEPGAAQGGDKEEALMKQMSRFRSEPLQYVPWNTQDDQEAIANDISFPDSSAKYPSTSPAQDGAHTTT